jgi:hypothetical protein
VLFLFSFASQDEMLRICREYGNTVPRLSSEKEKAAADAYERLLERDFSVKLERLAEELRKNR